MAGVGGGVTAGVAGAAGGGVWAGAAEVGAIAGDEPAAGVAVSIATHKRPLAVARKRLHYQRTALFRYRSTFY